MNLRYVSRLLVFSLVPLVFYCSTSNPKQPMSIPGNERANDSLVNRRPAVAGSFYPGSAKELASTLSDLFASAEPRKVSGNIQAVISPHAGYVFSGGVAASAFHQLDPGKVYRNVFVIGSSHRFSFDGASVYTRGNYEMPLGTIPVDLELARKLINDPSGVFTDRTDAQIYEHSLEVQLPFLQEIYGNKLTIVPIVIGTQRASVCKKIAQVLKPYMVPENLFVISTDFSHYPGYEDAVRADALTADAICTNSPENFLNTIRKTEAKGIPGLVTCICGWTSVLTLLYMTEDIPGIEYHKIQYRNSGDSPYGERDRVVGYYAITVTTKAGTSKEKQTTRESKRDEFSLSVQEKKALISIARNTLENYIRNGKTPPVEQNLLTPALETPCGAFVTLRKKGELRGCIGRFDPTEPLWKIVQEMTIAAAVHDYRFDPVDRNELKEIDIEISVLTPLQRIHSPEEIRLGIDGIYIRKGSASGTFLPQVARETNWTLEEFLGHCARDKAGIGWNGWKDAELYTYQALIIEEKDFH